MAKQQKEQPSMWERSEYEVLREWEEDGKKCAEIRNTYNGAHIICRIPHHTEEEKRILGGKIARAMTQMCFPDMDLSQCKKIEVVW